MKFISLVCFLIGITNSSMAGVISPQNGQGAGIDPIGNSEVDATATGSALISDFEGHPDRYTQVNWSGISGATGNTIDGEDIDVRIDHVDSAFVASTSDQQNYNTGSAGNGYRWTGTNAQELVISFGTYSGTFTRNRAVKAAGFVLLNFGAAYSDVTITYLDENETVLSVQSFQGGPDTQGQGYGGGDFFTGYVSDFFNIAQVRVVLTRVEGESSVALDALTYIAPPRSSQMATSEATADFDSVGDYLNEFSNALYQEVVNGGLNESVAINLENLGTTSFDGPNSTSLSSGAFSDGRKFLVGAFFKATSLGDSGQLLRLGITNGGDDNFAGLPFVSIELIEKGGRFVVRNGGVNEPSDPMAFRLNEDQWYYFEVCFSRLGNSTSVAVNYEATLAEASSDGVIGELIRSFQVVGQTGGHSIPNGIDGSELNKSIYGAFKGHDALEFSEAVIDGFYVSDSGVSQIRPENEVSVSPELRIVDMKFVDQEFHVELEGFDPIKQYVFKRSDDLLDGFPTQIGEVVRPASQNLVLVDPNPPSRRAFYRIEGVEAPRPNIVFVLMDDFGYNDIGVQTFPNPTEFYPNIGPTPKLNFSEPNINLPQPNLARLLTPRIDELAAQGIRLTSFHSSPKCSPARASLLTGRYDRRVDVNYVFWPDGRNGGGLNTHEITFPEVLRELGYATSLIGKWHLGYQVAAPSPFQLMPRRHGFEEFFGLPHSNGMTDLSLCRDEMVLDSDYSAPEKQAQLTWRYTEETLDFIDRKVDERQPFFVMLSHTMPHIPVYPSDQNYQNKDGSLWPIFKGASGMSSYYDVVMEADHSLGRILDRIADLGISDNTLVIFTSDNGPWSRLDDPNLLERSVGSAYPLRDSKLTTWEGGCRVPFIARWSGVIPPAVTSDIPVGMVDLFPTLIGLAGGGLPKDRVIDGENLMPLLSGEQNWKPARECYALFEQNTGSLGAVIDGHWKLRNGALYNLSEDIQESHDLSGEEAEVLEKLQAAADAVNISIASETRARGVFTDYEIQLSRDAVDLPAHGEGSIQVRLSGNPRRAVAVNVNRFTGNSHTNVVSESSLAFDESNWQDWQTVTFSRGKDAQPFFQGATFRLSSQHIDAVREVFVNPTN